MPARARQDRAVHVALNGIRQARREAHDRLLVMFVGNGVRAARGRNADTAIDGCSIRLRPTPGTIRHHVDAERGEFVGRADAASHQQCGTVNRTRRYDHATAPAGLHACRPRATMRAPIARLPSNRMRSTTSPVRIVRFGACARGVVEIADGSRDAFALRTDRDRTDERAVLPRPVLIVVQCMAALGE